MQRDTQIRVVDGWAASDRVQWVVQRQRGKSWVASSFVRLKIPLRSSMERAGVPRHIRKQLIEGLPGTFDEWLERTWHGVAKQSTRQSTAEEAKAA
jgi:hypothetical protein